MTDKEWERIRHALEVTTGHWQRSGHGRMDPDNLESYQSRVRRIVEVRDRRAWKAGRDAAAVVCDQQSKQRRRQGFPQDVTECSGLATAIRALQPPAEKETEDGPN